MRLDHDKYPAHCPEATPTFEAETTPTFEAYQLSCKIAASKHQNDAFLLANEDQLFANCTQMAQDFPQIQPYFGKFLWNKLLDNSYFNYNLSRSGDYLFRNNYLGRSENTGILSQQFIMSGGGFKSFFEDS